VGKSMKVDVIECAVTFEAFLKNDAQVILDKDAKRRKGEDVDFWHFFDKIRDILSRITDFLSRVDSRYSKLSKIHSHLGAGQWMNFGGREPFKEVIQDLKTEYQVHKSDLTSRLSTLYDDEKERLNEAFHSLKEECFWSSVANCAVLLESRLLKILTESNAEFLKTKNGQLRFSFGELVDIYLDNKNEFKNCIPDRHDYVLKLLNKYRIFSVHAKQVIIDQNEADALFNLTLSFIFDPKCVVTKRKGSKKK
jgi:hypothetical protein